MSRRIRSRHIEIFNFSFLDILACTIGLLIFILVMVFILQSGSPIADTEAVIRRDVDAESAASLLAARDNQIAASLESQLARIHVSTDPSLLAEREASREARDAAKSAYEQERLEARRAEERLDEARRLQENRTSSDLREAEAKFDAATRQLHLAEEAITHARTAPTENQVSLLPHARPEDAADVFQILHVECRADRVILLEVDRTGAGRKIGEASVHNLVDENSPFMQAVKREQGLPRPLVLFWVRPDGIRTFEKAAEALPAGLDRGYEPAEKDWILESRSK